ncbi:MAG TPA: winged helix-turn-helix transcriptional regulator, partial [Arthrobacter sp.]
AQRRRRAAKKLVLVGEKDHPMDQWTTSDGPRKGPVNGPRVDHQKDHPVDHSRTTPKKRPEVDPKTIRDLSENERLSQRAIASKLGVSKTTVARVLSDAGDPVGAH